MNPQELEACRELREMALDQVATFYKACVPQRGRGYFMKVAEAEFPEQLKEINELKIILNSEPSDVPSYTHACNRFAYVSKELTRKVSFLLARKILL